MIRVLLALTLLLGGPVLAQGYHEPARGTAERRALMDAIRPDAEALLGAPVEFVVDELRVAGDVAFAMLSAQRPGGVPIDIRSTPFARSEFYDPLGGDPTQLQVFFHRVGGAWIVEDWGAASTDVWWAQSPLCLRYRVVIPEYC